MKKSKKDPAWNDKETFLVMKCAGHIPVEMIAEILGRTVGSVQGKAQRHGIFLGLVSKRVTL